MHALLLIVVLSMFRPAAPHPTCIECPVIYTFDEVGWSVSGDAEIGSTYGSASPPNAAALSWNGIGGMAQDVDTSFVQIDYPNLQLGESYRITAMVNADAAVDGSPVMFFVGVPNYRTFRWYLDKSALSGAGWQEVTIGVFTQWHDGQGFPDSSRNIGAATNTGLVGEYSPCFGRWLVDQITVERVGGDPMAVLLGELPLRATLALYQANLPGELTAIQAERGDSVSIDAPTKYRCWKADAPSPDVTECEVYLDPSGSSFPTFAQDANRYNVGGRTPMRSSVRVIVAVNHANRVGYKVSEMAIRSLRIGAALARVLRNSPTLGLSGMSIMCRPDPVRYSTQIVGGDNPREIQRTEFSFVADVSENADLETTAGGGVPPACTLET